MRPAHYKGKGDLQPIHLIHALGLGFDAGCVVKYVCRAGRKPGEEALQDLRKARQYLDWLIAEAEGRPVIKPDGWGDNSGHDP